MHTDLLRAAIRAATGAVRDGAPNADFTQAVRDAYIGLFDFEADEGPDLEAAADVARDLTIFALAVKEGGQ